MEAPDNRGLEPKATLFGYHGMGGGPSFTFRVGDAVVDAVDVTPESLAAALACLTGRSDAIAAADGR